MYSRLLKFVPLVIVFVGFSQIIPKFKNVFQYTKIVATQADVNNIARDVGIELSSETIEFTDERFAEFIRSHLKITQERVKNKRTDPSLDFWGTPFHFIPAQETRSARVVSAGPDSVFNTKDDIFAVVY